jgi:hypothetical protein
MTDTIFPAFRDQQQVTPYPFADDATLRTSDGLTIDPAMFLDVSLHPVGLTAGGRLASVTVTTASVAIAVGDRKNVQLATAVFDTTTLPPVLKLLDSHNRSAGILLADPLLLAVLRAWPIGKHVFPIGAAEFVASVCIPSPVSVVEGFTVNGAGLLTDEVWLAGDRGVVLREIDGEIRVDIVGDPLFVRRLCQSVRQFATPRFIKTINGCPPDAAGNFNITVGNSLTSDTIIRIYPRDGGLQIESAGPLIQG